MGGPPINPPAQCSAQVDHPCRTCGGDGAVIQHEDGCPGKPATLCECPEVRCSTCKGAGETTRQCGNDAVRGGLCHEHRGQAMAYKADQRLAAIRDGERG
jgi:hypothetical protein